MSQQQSDQWSSKLGVILAVAGSAVGFGNFLRFPGLAAQFGGGAFMVAYFCSLLLLGIPLCWIEWGLGRRAGTLGCHTSSSLYQMITGSRFWKYFGAISLITPLSLGMYYMYIEGWTLGYCYHMAIGDFNANQAVDFSTFFTNFVGLEGNGSVFSMQDSYVLIFFLISLIINIYLIYRGVSKGIEWFCKWSMPMLILTAIIVMVRVLTLGTPDANYPERNVDAGMGYMWNPDKTILVADGKTLEMIPADATPEQTQNIIERVQAANPNQQVSIEHVSFIEGLMNPDLWIAAAGQIFFSLSVGFGTVLTYASYVKKKEDIALSSLAANAANEVIEVGIAGMMIVPAAVSFLGVAAAAGASTFGLGFNVLPQVFASMPMGQVFGTLFFGLLYLAAITSSISLMQPSIAFIEEFWGLRRKQSALIVTFFLGVGSLIVAWFTGDGLIALDTLDFFYGTLSLYICCTGMLIIFTRLWGSDKGLNEINRGGLIKVPHWMKHIMTWITPAILLTIFLSWLYKNIFVETSPQIQRVIDLEIGALIPLGWTFGVFIFYVFIIRSSKRFKNDTPHVEQMSDEKDNQREFVS